MRPFDERVAIAAWTIALCLGAAPVAAQDGCLADLNDDGVVNGTDLAIVLGGWGPCPVNTTFVGGVVKTGGVPVPGATIISDLGGKTVSGAGGIFLLEVELPSVIETVTLSASAEIDGLSFEGSKVVSPVNVGGNNLVGLLTIESDGCDGGFGWSPTAALDPGADGEVTSVVGFDDGTGQAIYVGGNFQTIGGVPANRVARWDGTQWTPLGDGLPGRVTCMAVYDHGTGPLLHVAHLLYASDGTPMYAVQRWTGKSWDKLALANKVIRCMAVHNPGSGPVLACGGDFQFLGGLSGGSVTDRSIANWNGAEWSAGCQGGIYRVTAMCAYDDGNGERLYATFDSVNVRGLYQVLPLELKALLSGGSGTGRAMAVFDDGSGPALYVGGDFLSPASNIIRFDGVATTPVVSGVNGAVNALAVLDDGSGPALYVGGEFSTASTINASRVARWTGQAWSALGVGIAAPSTVGALGAAGSGGEAALLVGGSFTSAGNLPASNVAQWGCIDP